MREFDSKAYFDATFREARFDRFYIDFFNVKMKTFLKEVNRLHYDCSQACITEEAVDGACLDSCGSVYEHFFRHVEGVIQGRLVSYPKCLDDCKDRMPLAECCDKCIDETVAQLNRIDPTAEFSRFLEFTEWKTKSNIS